MESDRDSNQTIWSGVRCPNHDAVLVRKGEYGTDGWVVYMSCPVDGCTYKVETNLARMERLTEKIAWLQEEIAKAQREIADLEWVDQGKCPRHFGHDVLLVERMRPMAYVSRTPSDPVEPYGTVVYLECPECGYKVPKETV